MDHHYTTSAMCQNRVDPRMQPSVEQMLNQLRDYGWTVFPEEETDVLFLRSALRVAHDNAAATARREGE